MIRRHCLVTLLLIAISPYSHWAKAEKVYKCGSTYSQTPCPGSTTLELDDTRDPAEKKRMDAQTRRNADLARDMEQSRLASEAALATERAKQTESAGKRKQDSQLAKGPPAEPVLVYAHKPRLYKPHKPKAFIAEVPGTGHPATKPRKGKNRPDDAR